jgi:4a-hydroxytetrahydrobiopterin dehydratase
MNLVDQQCRHGAPALGQADIAALLPQVPGWSVEGGRLVRTYEFMDYHQTIAFVNALAEMIHAQDQHPGLTVSYRHCTVAYATHTAGNAISQNDFICAAKANAIYTQRDGA